MLRDVKDVPEPTIRELIEIRDIQRAQQVEEIFGRASQVEEAVLDAVNNVEAFSVDQLDETFREYGERWGRHLHLGVIGALDHRIYVPGRVDEDLGDPDQIMIWIEHDPRGAGHYSAISPKGHGFSPDDYVSVYNDVYLTVILPSIGALLVSSCCCERAHAD